MPHILYTFDTTPSKPPELKTFGVMLRKLYEQLARLVNGLLSFGNGIDRDNIAGAWVTVTTPVAPNTDFVVVHNLGTIPVGYWVMTKDRAVDIYTGSAAPTTTEITLRASVASAHVVLFIV